jgi:hypothetical protein
MACRKSDPALNMCARIKKLDQKVGEMHTRDASSMIIQHSYLEKFFAKKIAQICIGNSVAAPNSAPAAVSFRICRSFQALTRKLNGDTDFAEIQKQAADLRCDCDANCSRRVGEKTYFVFAWGLCLFNKCTLQCKCLRASPQKVLHAPRAE